MSYILLIIVALLHLVTGVMNINIGHIGPWTMIFGSLLILFGSYLGITSGEVKWWYLLIGIILVMDSAIYNGYQQQQINWLHHGIRLIIFMLALLPIVKFGK